MKKRLSQILLAGFIFSACKEKIPTRTLDEAPQIVLIQAPPTVYQFPAQPVGIHVRASDAQGVSDLSGVALAVKKTGGNVVNTRALTDDGLQGDILPNDGQYFAALDTALLRNQTGTFVLEAVARDKNQNQSAPARDTVQVLGGVENRLPNISSVIAPQSVHIDTDYVFIFSASVNDPDGAATVRLVIMETYPPSFAKPSRVDTLRDHGRNGDGRAGDGIFSAGVRGRDLGTQCGLYSLAFRPVDNTNGVGSAALHVLRATRLRLTNNTPPRLSSLTAPATISRSATPNNYVLSVQAGDADVECNDAIARVFFNTFLPDGNAATGNPFAMRDDGQAGDATAGDGRYSLTISITPQNNTGNYRFEFQAQDRAGALSEKIIHTIMVTP